MNRRELIEAEAKKRCLLGGFALDTPVRVLSSHSDRDGAIWEDYVPKVAAEVEQVEAMGFTVLDGEEDCIGDDLDAPLEPFSWPLFTLGLALVALVIWYGAK